MTAKFSQNFNYISFIKYLIPSVLSMIFVSFYTTIDGFFVSNYVNSNALAAINIVLPITCVNFGIPIMLSTGASAIVGKKLGENKKTEANQIFSFMFYALIVISLIITILGVIFLDDFLRFVGSTATLDPYTKPYGLITFLMIPVVMIKLFLEMFMHVDGNSKVAMKMSIVGLILNVIFDYIFIVILQMGITGAGLGTALSILFSCLIGIAHFFGKKSNLKMTKAKLDFKLFFKACYNGSSEMFTELSTGITTLLFNIILLRNLGENGVAAMSVITYLFYFFIAVYFGISVGTAPIISYNYGARDNDKIQKVIKYSFITIISSSVLVFLTSFIFSEQILSIFITEAAVMSIANNGLRIFSVCFLMIGINIFISGYFTSIGNGGLSAIISISRSLVFVVIYLFTLSYIFGLNGVWMTIPVAEFSTIIISIFIYNRKKLVIKN